LFFGKGNFGGKKFTLQKVNLLCKEDFFHLKMANFFRKSQKTHTMGQYLQKKALKIFF
jgi:hypothetical protein